jgi:hypothetical protein
MEEKYNFSVVSKAREDKREIIGLWEKPLKCNSRNEKISNLLAIYFLSV